MRPFRAKADGIEVRLTPEMRMFLGDVLPMLAAIGDSKDDPAAQRLQVPVYLDDTDSNDEWWRLMGPDLDAARQADRRVFKRTIESDEPLTLSDDEADSLLRVLNESRLALGARMGVEVEEDYEGLSEDSRTVLAYLGAILEDLTEELSGRL
jgi:hypothetical protein